MSTVPLRPNCQAAMQPPPFDSMPSVPFSILRSIHCRSAHAPRSDPRPRGAHCIISRARLFFFVARGRSVGHKTLRQPKQMALFFGRINLQSSRFESKTILLNVKKCYPIPSSSAKSLGASVFFCFFFVLLVKHISWSIFIQLDPVGVSQSTEGSQFRKWVSDTSAPARSQAFASVRAPGGWWCWCQGQKMPGASANHLGLDQNDQTFRALGGKKTSTHLAGLHVGDRRIKMKPATTRSRQKEIIHKSCVYCILVTLLVCIYVPCIHIQHIHLYNSKCMQVRKRWNSD